MQDTHAKVQRRKHSWRVVWISLTLLLVIPVLLCGGVATWFFGRQSVAMADWDRTVAELRDRGDPVDNESLQAFYESRTSPRDTQKLVELRKVIESREFQDSVFTVPLLTAGGASELDELGEETKAARAFLDRWSSELALVHAIAESQQEPGVKPVRHSTVFCSHATLLPETQASRDFARLLSVEHAVTTLDEDPDRAFRCIQSCRGLTRSTSAQPIIISVLVAGAMDLLANDMLRLSLQRDQLTGDQLEKAEASLIDFDAVEDLYCGAIRGERAMGLEVFEDPSLAMDSTDGAEQVRVSRKTRGIDAVYYLKAMDALLAVSRENMSEFRDSVAKVQQRCDTELRAMNLLDQFTHILSGLLLPASSEFANALIRRVENNRLAKLAIGIRRFEHRFDRWPESLDELDKIGVDADALRTANDQLFGFRIEDNGDAMLWGVPDSDAEPIPEQPPEIKLEDSPYQGWVWRLEM